MSSKPSIISSILIWWPYYIAKRFSDALLQQQNENSGPATVSFDLLPATDDEFRADHLQKRYETAVRRFDRSGLVRDLWRIGWEIGGGLYALAIIPLIFVNLLRYLKPLIVNWMLDSLQKEGFGKSVIVYICIITAAEILQGYLQIHHEILVRRCWLRIMIAVRSAVLHKALRLSSKSMAKFSSAEISNLVSQDLQTVVEALQWLHNLWAAPLNLVLMIISLFWLLGLPALAVLGCMLVILPANMVVMRKQAQAWEEKTEKADRRTTVISDVIEGIRVVKMFAWEELFAEKVSKIRKEEERALWKSFLYSAGTSWVWWVIWAATCGLSFGLYVVAGHVLTPAIAFSVLLVANESGVPLAFIPMSLGHLVKCRVAVSRISRFLNEPEKDSTLDDEDLSSKSDTEAIFVKGSFAWPRGTTVTNAREESESAGLLQPADSAEPESACLVDINLNIRPGTLCAIVGAVGAGKTSLLHALLGEMTPLEGSSRNLPGKISYVSQEAVILNGTVRQNILFDWDDDMPFAIDETRYRAAITFSALGDDLKQLENGDKTRIGDKGVNLSGGQKQRVALARAFYADADVYLFDDPLSAVDVNVGKYLYDEFITNQLRNKTRVLVTHQTQYLASADLIVLMDHGRIVEHGTYKELVSRPDSAFVRLMKKDDEKDVDGEEDVEEKVVGEQKELKKSASNMVNLDDDEEEEETADSHAESSFNLRLFMAFHRFAGSWAWVALMWSLFILSELSGGALVITATMLSIADPEKGELVFFLKLYIYICFQVSFVSFFRNLVQSHVFLRIASNMHQALLDAVVRTRTSFFDSTPQGRIMSRFSNDQLQMDSSMLWSTREFWSAISMVVDLSVIMVVFAPLTFILIIALFGCYYLANRFYVRAVTALSRLKSISLGDIFSHVTESLEAVVTIRAYGASNRFEQHNLWLNNRDARTCAAYEYVMSWYGAVVRLISSIFVFFVLMVASWESGSSAYVGLIILCSMSISSSVGWIFETLGMQQGLYVNLNRIVEFTELPSESSQNSIESVIEPDSDWPKKGEIEFDSVHLSYEQYSSGVFSQSTRQALQNVSFKIVGGERIGIVGRTGAGKSSLLSALFRLAEISSGSIKIDGVDIHRLSLSTLRRALAIVPQHPAMFQGSLRENIDPFSQHEDKIIWECLGRVQLAKFVGSLEGGLSSQIVEGGSNLSVGQRQLICLARALLMKRRSPNLILVLDECTASVDYATDAIIQQVAREEFEGSTVIVIAHRLDTVMLSDRILVMDAGRPAEFDTPTNLLANGGIFAQMVAQFKTQMKK